jgi:recombination protein RecA
VVKNKVAAPFKEVEFDIMFGLGISKEGDVLDLASAPEAEIIQKSGTWFTYNGERLGQGRENAKEYLREHPETMAKIEAAVRAKANLIKTQSSGEQNVADEQTKSLPGSTAALPPSNQANKATRRGAGASVAAE